MIVETSSLRPALRTAYGLAWRSDVDLPELEPLEGDRAADLTVHRAPLDDLPGEGGFRTRFAPDRAELWWQTVGGFRVEPGRITASPHPGVSEDLVAYPLLGSVLALALEQLGLFTLHASAVSVGGRGVVMMGDKGAGKSTTATAMIRAGHPLIADDIVAVDETLSLRPGFPQVKLSPAAAAAFDAPDAVHRPVVPEVPEKSRVLLPGRFARGVTPLRRIYRLERGPAEAEPAVIAVPPFEALPLALRFAYVTRFGAEVLNGAAGARHLRQAAAIAASGVLHRVIVPHDLRRLPEVVALIERDAEAAA
ncbi:serine kinase [Cereibacter azotoformans]|uniref:Hpr(Ser) kinase/phosphatase n=2 Tax=Cereibacter TaxID=1653176 RepID=A0A2T5KB42_9RHOB|nr:HPr kinase [Cereibacter azotoformans]AXQ93874.1 serine kinase [Cereibacter sphaeroides]MBO4168319.1 serine kinase [Cereibacter azotoformans]PTR19633.1 Hpr(Ser) kinase/phosphatase [Cereibacter azotoformans]UIJ29390.1 serine kinase [Cereibacter azotoformans]ULB10101.1 serine kinase [Cereibacter azotoformans]